MGKFGTFNEDVFHSVFGLACMMVAALFQVNKNVLSLYDLYEVWIRQLLFLFFCSLVSTPSMCV